jgi:hypothetical protein
MDDEKKVIEKRSSFRGWKERNSGKSHQKKYIIAAVTMVVIFLSFIIYQYLNQNDTIIPEITPEETPEITPEDTPEITGNIIGKIGASLELNGFEINVTRADPSALYLNVWIIVKNLDDSEKTFKIGPSTVVMDNMGQQYERVEVERAGMIQTNLAAKAMRDGAIFFDPLREGRSPKKLILEINGKKAEIMLEK